uniref:SUN domain-containing ossification factor-like n=1 Tax=Saccoglossus kowalevskii TaxID=10224 RepID=A0ABM0MKV6_SACKO
FTVELCEPLQIKQIEIANFELFSSTPKTLKVQISDRYQSRDWHYLGTFHAIDQRTLQSFTIQDQGGMFAKYLKVEMLDFFGSEHYCPLSIIRVFGTSMEEEIIQESESHGANGDEEGDDDLVPGEGLKKANLLDSALDAVNHVVKRAAKALLGSEDARPSDCT